MPDNGHYFAQLPAHSTKPTTMGMLLELEDERDALLARIDALKERG